jgi:uncharacterized protein (TIGR01370 family)
MQLIKIILFVLPSLLVSDAFGNGINKNSVFVCYGRLEPESIKGYNYVILESKYYTFYEVQRIKSQNDKVIAYISLGEINANSFYFNQFNSDFSGKNEVWNSYYLNLKSKKTLEILMKMVDNILANGYDGLFLDNIDNFSDFGPQFNQKEDVIQLIIKIKTDYFNHILIQNSGLQLISETAKYIDSVVFESVASNYTFGDKSYKLRNEFEFEEYVNRLISIKKQYNLPILLIEYADTIPLRNAIEKRIKPSRFDYFIGNINLQAMPNFIK